MNTTSFQRFLNGIILKPRFDFDCGLHVAKILFSKKSELSQKEVAQLLVFISCFLDKFNVQQQLKDVYYMKQQQIVQLIYQFLNQKQFKQKMIINLNKLSSYVETHQQSLMLQHITLLRQFVGAENFYLVPENQMQYFYIYINYFSEKPDYNMNIDSNVLYKDYFEFYKIQQQNQLTNIRILKQLLYFNKKFYFDLNSVIDIHLFGGKKQMFNVKVFLTQETIKLIIRFFSVSEENQLKLQEIESKDVKNDVVYQQQENPKQWSYSSDIFIELVKKQYIDDSQFINKCLGLGRLGSKPFFCFDIEVSSLQEVDQTIQFNKVINEIVINQKYKRESVDFLISQCDAQLIKPLVKSLVLHHYINNLNQLLNKCNYYMLFVNNVYTSQKINEIITFIIKNEDQTRSTFYLYMCEVAQNASIELSNYYFDQCFLNNIDSLNTVNNNKLKQQNSEILEQQTIQIQLIDPITLQQIKDPSRGSRCSHLQPLNKQTYVLNGECPLCKQPVNQVMDDIFCIAIIQYYLKLTLQVKSVTLDINKLNIIQHEHFQQEESSEWFAGEEVCLQVEQKQIQNADVKEVFTPISNVQKNIALNQSVTPQIPRSTLYSKQKINYNGGQQKYELQIADLLSEQSDSCAPDTNTQPLEQDAFVNAFREANSLQNSIRLTESAQVIIGRHGTTESNVK